LIISNACDATWGLSRRYILLDTSLFMLFHFLSFYAYNVIITFFSVRLLSKYMEENYKDFLDKTRLEMEQSRQIQYKETVEWNNPIMSDSLASSNDTKPVNSKGSRAWLFSKSSILWKWRSWFFKGNQFRQPWWWFSKKIKWRVKWVMRKRRRRRSDHSTELIWMTIMIK